MLQFDLMIFVDLNQPDSDADPLKKGLVLTVHFRGKFINYVRYLPVLWIRKYFFRIRGYVILNTGIESGSGVLINYGSGRIRNLLRHFSWSFKNILSNTYLW